MSSFRTNLHSISLLWPPGHPVQTLPRVPHLTDSVQSDLDLTRLVTALSPTERFTDSIRAILATLCDEPAVLHYRYDIIDDLLTQPDIIQKLSLLLPIINAFEQLRYATTPGQTPLHEVAWRIGQLEAYVECISGLVDLFAGAGHDVHSEGLRYLRDLTVSIESDELYRHLVAELPEMIAQVRNIASVTVGINLDDQLRPAEATLLAINSRKFRGESHSLLTTLFGQHAQRNEWQGIAPLHSRAHQATAVPRDVPGVNLNNPMLYPLFRDLADVLKRISRPVAAALQQYARINIQVLGNLGVELGFYLGAVALIQRMRAVGLPMCRPHIAPLAERVSELRDAYNISLALRFLSRDGSQDLSQTVVTNDAHFGPTGRIFILTGPNQGGKTTYTQMIGLIHVLAQAGLWVPCREAIISPVDNVFTHFPAEERPDTEAGRLGEEALRLGEIFARATQNSLILLNESLSSTSPGEAVYLACDIVRGLRRLGARALYATHLHDLAASVEELNSDTPGDSQVVSLVTLIQERAATDSDSTSIRQTYQIRPGPPIGRSYAREIAARYGISYEQLVHLLHDRGVIDGRGQRTDSDQPIQ